MDAFEFYNPVKIVFGKGRVNEIGTLVADIADALLLCTGSGSVHANGAFDKVAGSLEAGGVSFLELSGIRSNPVLSTVRRGIELVKAHELKGVVALGGGSVMDTAKAVAAGAMMDQGDIWDCFCGKREIEAALPVVTVPTLAASGSEMNGFMVITNEEEGYKLAAGSPHVYPALSVLDPELTFTVPASYTAYGGIDAVCHLLEPYFNRSWNDTPVQDGITYGLIRAIASETQTCLETPDDYNARANLMWGATLALNGLTKSGVGQHFFPVHLIEHSISALFDVPHGAGLAALLPGWMEWFAATGHDSRVSELGENLYGIQAGSSEHGAAETVSQFSAWILSLDCPIDLKGLSISRKDHEAIAENAMRQAGIWEFHEYSEGVVLEILERCQERS